MPGTTAALPFLLYVDVTRTWDGSELTSLKIKLERPTTVLFANCDAGYDEGHEWTLWK